MTTTEHRRTLPAADVTVGVDIVDVGRVARLAAEPTGLTGVLTERELGYCAGRRRPGEHIAARFAAKEAVMKAFGTGLAAGVRWTDVEVARQRGGRPTVVLHGAAAAQAAARRLLRIDISLSHTDQLAIAQVVALWAPGPSEATMPSSPTIRSREDVPPDRRRGGEVRVLLSPRTAGSTSGFMGTAELTPGERIAEHYHPYSEEFVYVVGGAISAELDGAAHPLAAGEGLLIAPHVRHRLVNDGPERASLVFHLGPLAPRPELGHVDTETDGGPGSVAVHEQVT